MPVQQVADGIQVRSIMDEKREIREFYDRSVLWSQNSLTRKNKNIHIEICEILQPIIAKFNHRHDYELTSVDRFFYSYALSLYHGKIKGETRTFSDHTIEFSSSVIREIRVAEARLHFLQGEISFNDFSANLKYKFLAAEAYLNKYHIIERMKRLGGFGSLPPAVLDFYANSTVELGQLAERCLAMNIEGDRILELLTKLRNLSHGNEMLQDRSTFRVFSNSITLMNIALNLYQENYREAQILFDCIGTYLDTRTLSERYSQLITEGEDSLLSSQAKRDALIEIREIFDDVPPTSQREIEAEGEVQQNPDILEIRKFYTHSLYWADKSFWKSNRRAHKDIADLLEPIVAEVENGADLSEYDKIVFLYAKSIYKDKVKSNSYYTEMREILRSYIGDKTEGRVNLAEMEKDPRIITARLLNDALTHGHDPRSEANSVAHCVYMIPFTRVNRLAHIGERLFKRGANSQIVCDALISFRKVAQSWKTPPEGMEVYGEYMNSPKFKALEIIESMLERMLDSGCEIGGLTTVCGLATRYFDAHDFPAGSISTYINRIIGLNSRDLDYLLNLSQRLERIREGVLEEPREILLSQHALGGHSTGEGVSVDSGSESEHVRQLIQLTSGV